MYDILVLGAAFDPPHLGHREMAREVIARGIAKEVYLVPCKQHAFAKTMIPITHRLAMTEKLSEDKISVNTLELEREGVSYAYDTLQVIAQQTNKKVGWLIGSDLVATFAKWYRYREILQEFGVMVYPREGTDGVELLPGMQWVTRVERIAISSTKVRELIENGGAWENMVVPDVAAYIKQHQLYATTN